MMTFILVLTVDLLFSLNYKKHLVRTFVRTDPLFVVINGGGSIIFRMSGVSLAGYKKYQYIVYKDNIGTN